jgi:ABC-type sugar transport system permease subunit
LRHLSQRESDTLYGYLMILPFFGFFVLFVFFPVLINTVLSFTSYDLRSIRFVGLKNYEFLLQDEFMHKAFRNTLVYMVSTVSVTLVLSFFAALLLNKQAAIIKFARASFFLPYVTSMVAVSVVWIWIYEPSMGVLNRSLVSLGLAPRQWLYDPKLALGSIIAMSIWKGLGYSMIIFLAGLQGIPREMLEAAQVDGANSAARTWHITIPMLRPVVFFLLVTGTIGGFNVFEQVNVMTSGGPLNRTTTVVHQIYSRAFQELLIGYAAAIAVSLILVMLAMTLVNLRIGSQRMDSDFR